MRAAHTSGNNKSRKLGCAAVVVFFVLAVMYCIMSYTFVPFPLDMDEEQCEILTNETTRIILCRRSGNATVAFHFVLYENEIKPDNVIAIIKDAGIMPKLRHSDKGDGDVMVSVSDVNDIVYLLKKAVVYDLQPRGALIKLNIK